MIKFSPNVCYCAVYQEKVVLKRKRAVSSPSAFRAWKAHEASRGPSGGLGKKFKLPCEIFGEVPREASGKGLRGPLKRAIWGLVHCLGCLVLAGLTAQPTAACGTGSSVARRRALGSRAASPVGFGAFALLDGAGLTQFRA